MVRDIVEGFREVIRDLLIPEFKALQTEVRHLGERLGKLEQVMEERFARVEERFAHVEERFARVDEHFARVDERFARVDQRFDAVHKEILDLAKAISTINGKLDILMGQMADYKEVVRLTVRVETLERQVSALTESVRQLAAGRSTGP